MFVFIMKLYFVQIKMEGTCVESFIKNLYWRALKPQMLFLKTFIKISRFLFYKYAIYKRSKNNDQLQFATFI